MVVIVLGIPRSGTSMVAEIIHALGISMGESLLPASRWNQRGFYEDLQFLHLNRIFTFAHGDLRRSALQLPAEAPNLTPDLCRRYRRLIAAKARQHTHWGVKDPRLIFMYDALLSFLQPQHKPVHVVATKRPHEESTASLMNMFSLAYGDAQDIVNSYARRLEAQLAALVEPHFVVEYPQALEAPGTVVTELAHFLEVPVTTAAQEVIDPSLRRHGHDYP